MNLNLNQTPLREKTLARHLIAALESGKVVAHAFDPYSSVTNDTLSSGIAVLDVKKAMVFGPYRVIRFSAAARATATSYCLRVDLVRSAGHVSKNTLHICDPEAVKKLGLIRTAIAVASDKPALPGLNFRPKDE